MNAYASAAVAVWAGLALIVAGIGVVAGLEALGYATIAYGALFAAVGVSALRRPEPPEEGRR